MNRAPAARRASRRGWSLMRLITPVVAALIGLWGLAAAADAATPTSAVAPAPLVLAASATPAEVGFHGGTVVVNGRVKNAATCQLRLLSHQGFPVVFASNKRPCTSTFSARVTIGANPSTVSRTVAFELIAQNAAKSFDGRFYITLAPMPLPPPPVSATISVSPDELPSSGGNVTLSWTTENAIICTLSVIGPVSPSSYGAPGSSLADLIGASPQNVLCNSDMLLPIGAGMSSTQQWAFTLTAGTVGAGSAKATTTLDEAALKTSLTTMPPGSPMQQTTSNWAGYGVSGGPYTSVEGTFTVPSLATGAPASGVMSEWVGIDGLSGTNGAQDLVQAGVLESMLPCDGSSTYTKGAYSPDQFYICPWTFFIEDGHFHQGTVPDITLAEGDSVTVEIWQQSGTNWAISLTDTTARQSWSIGDQFYAGPGSSAEWIVEDPGTVGQGCGIPVDGQNGQCPLPDFTTPVEFSNMLSAPSAPATWYQIGLSQNSVQVATPTALSTTGAAVTGFSVSYTNAQAPAPVSQPSTVGPGPHNLASWVFAKNVERGPALAGSARQTAGLRLERTPPLRSAALGTALRR